MGSKVCSCCKKEIELSLFERDSRRLSGFGALCKPCKRNKDNVAAQTDTGKARANRGSVKWRNSDKHKAQVAQDRIVCAIGKLSLVWLRECESCGKRDVKQLTTKLSPLSKRFCAICVRAEKTRGYRHNERTVSCVRCGCEAIGKAGKRVCAECNSKAQAEGRRTYKHQRRARMAGLPNERVVPSVVFNRDGHRCCGCGCVVVQSKTWRTDMATIDHIVPISKGGGNTYNNTQTLCSMCNARKGDMILSNIKTNMFSVVGGARGMATP